MSPRDSLFCETCRHGKSRHKDTMHACLESGCQCARFALPEPRPVPQRPPSASARKLAEAVKAERERVLNEIEEASVGQPTVPWLHNVLLKLWGYRE